MNDEPQTIEEKPKAGWRFRLGLTIFIVGFASPLLIPLVTASDLSAQLKTILSGALAVGIPEIFSLVAVAIMGKSGFDTLKKRIFGLIKKHGPPERVGRARYRIGLVMFCLPLLLGWSGPYLLHHIPGYEAQRLLVGIIGDLLLISSLFVLGGQFWDKIRALFTHAARVHLVRIKNG